MENDKLGNINQFWLGCQFFTRPEVPLPGTFRGQQGQRLQNSVSLEPMVVESWLTPQNDRNTHFPICVSYNVYPKNQQKSEKMVFYPISGEEIGQIGIKSRFSLEMEDWNTLFAVKPILIDY